MAKCDRCNEHKPVKNSLALTGVEEEVHHDYELMQICDRCMSKAIQFSRGHDALEEIPLEDVADKGDGF